MGARVLVVEDDELIRTSLRLLLEDEGHSVLEATSGEEGLALAAEHRPDAVLLDITLPRLDGFQVCRELRRHSRVPILMLSARSDSHDQVAGLEAGADDYVVKPAEPKVLCARLRAALRRGQSGPDDDATMTFGDLEVDPSAATALLRGEAVPLSKTEFLLLCELARTAGKVLDRATLLERVWGVEFLGDSRLVDVAVRRLRLKIEDDPRSPTRIVTVRGLGYRFEP